MIDIYIYTETYTHLYRLIFIYIGIYIYTYICMYIYTYCHGIFPYVSLYDCTVLSWPFFPGEHLWCSSHHRWGVFAGWWSTVLWCFFGLCLAFYSHWRLGNPSVCYLGYKYPQNGWVFGLWTKTINCRGERTYLRYFFSTRNPSVFSEAPWFSVTFTCLK